MFYNINNFKKKIALQDTDGSQVSYNDFYTKTDSFCLHSISQFTRKKRIELYYYLQRAI